MTAAITRLGPADVRAAAHRIAGHVRRTPLLADPDLPGLWLKGEHRQLGGSFKLRGAANAVLALGARAFVTGSSGNHGIALATMAAPLGVPVTVVMAAGASTAKSDLIHALGGRTITVAGGVAERDRSARKLAEETGAVFVPSSDDELIIAGQGTVGREVLADAPDVATIFVPTGGGGLLAGVCLAVRDLPVRVVGVEPENADRYARSFAEGGPVRLPPSLTVADGLRGQQPGLLTYPVIRARVDELVAVSDAEIVAAQDRLARRGIAAEPSGAVALAGALRTGWRGVAAAIVSGGNTAEALAVAVRAHLPVHRVPTEKEFA